jgi:hypothetical protein
MNEQNVIYLYRIACPALLVGTQTIRAVAVFHDGTLYTQSQIRGNKHQYEDIDRVVMFRSHRLCLWSGVRAREAQYILSIEAQKQRRLEEVVTDAPRIHRIKKGLSAGAVCAVGSA